MSVPILDPVRNNESIQGQLESAALQVLRSGKFVLGEAVEKFEAECAQYLQCCHAIGVSSGTDALIIALMALGIGPGDEVICPSFTFFATAGAVSRVGATPVFVDIDLHSFNIDPRQIDRFITEKTRAIIPVHLFGQPANWEEILNVVSQHENIAVIEDVAQAFGATWNTLQAGSLGDLGCYSFFPTKNLGGFGDAGLVTTNDDMLAARLRSLRMHGCTKQYIHEVVGGNFRIDALQAAMLSVKLPYVDEQINQRRFNASYYRDQLQDTPYVLPREVDPRGRHSYNQFTILVQPDKRDECRAFLAERGVSTGIYYPLPLHRQECFKDLVPDLEQFKTTNVVSSMCLSLPIAPELRQNELDDVIDALSAFATRSL